MPPCIISCVVVEKLNGATVNPLNRWPQVVGWAVLTPTTSEVCRAIYHPSSYPISGVKAWPPSFNMTSTVLILRVNPGNLSEGLNNLNFNPEQLSELSVASSSQKSRKQKKR